MKLFARFKDEDDVNFIKGQLNHMSKTDLVRKSIKTYKDYLSGELISRELEEIKELIKNSNIDSKDKEKMDNKLRDKIRSKKNNKDYF